MEPLTSAALISSSGALLGTGANILNANNINAQNVAEQRRSNDIQIDLANTAFQRSKADMLAAGLNPGLMYGAGPAPSPNIGAARQEMVDVGSSFGTTAESLSRNLPQLMSLNQTMKNLEQDAIESVARTAKLRDELKTASSQRAFIRAQEALTKFQTQSKSVQEVGGRILDKTVKALNPGFWESTAQRWTDSMYNTLTGPDVAPLFEAPQ
nr:MAG: DNA pilot protein [Microvirus sp.]